MRIAAVNWCRAKAGGVESYLDALLPALAARGEQVALWHEAPGPVERGMIALPAGAPVWSAAEIGRPGAMASIAAWRPDVVFCHGLRDPAAEAALVELAPAVLFAHSYYGTCISGAKTYRFPTVRPCTATFGPACLGHHYLRRCGGWSPRTAWRDYRIQAARLELASRYRLVVTASEHMRAEYLRHGLAPERVRRVGLFVTMDEPAPTRPAPTAVARALRLLFVGRLDPLKGLATLIAALPETSRRLGRPLRLDVAGDGPDRGRLTADAARLAARHPAIEVRLHGWVAGAEKQRLMAEADLLAIPSLWPEPFGLVGVEAGRLGVPAVAFDVGGISDWLSEGINGHLATADPPTPRALADALVRALSDSAHLERLSRGAREIAERLTVDRHLEALLPLLVSAAAGSADAAGAAGR